jgi:hypothetical protein
LCKRRRVGGANHETQPPTDEQELAIDDSSRAQALLEMEGMLEEYEKHIVRPTSTHKQEQQIRERKQQANRKQCNYGDPFASQTAEHDFEISDGSESDDQLEDGPPTPR